MKERPILFSAPMIRAILAGTKTQTRRVIKAPGVFVSSGAIDGYGVLSMHDNDIREVRCPYGQPGSMLWVRETWGYFDPECSGEDYDDWHKNEGPGPRAYCDELLQEGHPLRDFWRRRVAYKATFAGAKYGAGPVGPKKWRPSIHMPRWASRITLEITDIRVERLQDISEADAEAEGFELGSPPCIYNPTGWYRSLWEEINGAGSWDVNPWVWCVSFKRLEA